MTAVGYTRVSTSGQEISPEAQRHAITKWASEQDHELLSFEDDVMTGKPRDFTSSLRGGVAITTLDLRPRPGLLRAIEMCRASSGDGSVDVLIAAKRDRFFRSSEAMAQLGRLIAPVRLVSVDLDLSQMGPAASIVAATIDATASHELVTIRQRTKAALAQLKRQGKRAGAVPFGWSDPEGHLPATARDPDRKLERNPREQKTIRRILELDERGLGPRAICTRLGSEQLRPRGAKWHPNTIRRILARAHEHRPSP